MFRHECSLPIFISNVKHICEKLIQLENLEVLLSNIFSYSFTLWLLANYNELDSEYHTTIAIVIAIKPLEALMLAGMTASKATFEKITISRIYWNKSGHQVTNLTKPIMVLLCVGNTQYQLVKSSTYRGPKCLITVPADGLAQTAMPLTGTVWQHKIYTFFCKIFSSMLSNITISIIHNFFQKREGRKITIFQSDTDSIIHVNSKCESN